MADLRLERSGPTDGEGATPATPTDTGADPSATDSPDGAPFGGPGTPRSTEVPRPIDPRSVRVGVGPGSRLDGEVPIVVAPLPEPLAPIRHTLAGRGPLGGTVRGVGPETAGPGITSGGDWPAGDTAARASQDRTTPPATTAVLVDGEPMAIKLERRGPGRAELVVGQGSAAFRHRLLLADDVATGPDGIVRGEVVVDGWRIEVESETERRAALRERARRGREATVHGGPTEVRAIIPGRVVSVSVAAGDPVAAGQQVLVVEAMKMQNELRAPRDGTIRRVAVGTGVTIEVGDLLLIIE